MKLIKSIAIFTMVQLSAFLCNATNTTSNKTFAVSSWSGAWTFTGFALGPSSGEYYHLLSTSVSNDCAIVKETTSGTVSWAKQYPAEQCAGLTIDSSETYAYFANNEAAQFGVTEVLCADGETSQYHTSSGWSISGGINNIDAVGYPGHVMFGGNILNGSWPCHGIWDRTDNRYRIRCVSSWLYLGSFALSNGFCISLRYTTSDEILIGCYYVSDLSPIWETSFNLTSSSSEQLNNGRIGLDTNYVYFVFDTVSLAGIFITVLDLSDGSIQGSMLQRVSSQQLKAGAVYATGSNIAYISVYSSSSAYAELIKYDTSNSNYTIYEQTGLNFRFQFINTALNDCWYALVDTEYIYLSQLSTMDEATGLTVNVLTNSGLTTETTANSTSTSGFHALVNHTVTSTSNTASNLTVSITLSVLNNTQTNTTTNTTTNSTTNGNSTTTTTNNNNDDDDGLNSLEIVLISVGVAVAIVILVGIGIYS